VDIVYIEQYRARRAGTHETSHAMDSSSFVVAVLFCATWFSFLSLLIRVNKHYDSVCQDSPGSTAVSEIKTSFNDIACSAQPARTWLCAQTHAHSICIKWARAGSAVCSCCSHDEGWRYYLSSRYINITDLHLHLRATVNSAVCALPLYWSIKRVLYNKSYKMLKSAAILWN